MSSELPEYKYHPPAHLSENAKLRTCSSRRARLYAGGTYFRVRDPGLKGNNIIVEVDELETPTAPGTGEAYCVVTNLNLKYDENVSNAEVKILNLEAKYTDLWIIDNLTTTPNIKYYSISLRIRNCIENSLPYILPSETQDQNPVEYVKDLGDFKFDKLFSSNKITVLLSKKDTSYTQEDRIFITPRVNSYALLADSATAELPENAPPETIPEQVLGWSIADLKLKINNLDPWIQMPERSSDSQATGIDDLVLSPFEPVKLKNGDGLPDTPSIERTGPSRSLVHVNYGETLTGSLIEHNTVYEWIGDDAVQGSWVNY